MRNKTRTCECGKHSYPSEAAANRAKLKYDDIKRIYPCYDTGKEVWHTTSENYKDNYFSREMERTYPTVDKINNRLNKLIEKVKENETKK